MEFEQKFDVNTKFFEVPNFKNWEEANCYDNRFIIDKKAAVEALITVKNFAGIHERILETFEKPRENLTDAMLIVEGEKVQVGKQILAMSSKFFHTLFYSTFSESSQKEITIEDVKHSEFVDFLNFVYPTHKCINKYMPGYALNAQRHRLSERTRRL
uniref:BTB domain-containing protein n=1 Tax=Caenorhabditis japonica TaxID=281687 RepID=A0A8R1IV93_CAEJA